MNAGPGKKFYFTMEFWASVVAAVAMFVASLTNGLSDKWAAIATAVVAALYAISRAITKMQAVNFRTGWKTSEFYFTMAVNVAVFASALTSGLPARYAAIAGTISTVAFTLSRAITKVLAGDTSTDVPPTPASTTNVAGTVVSQSQRKTIR